MPLTAKITNITKINPAHELFSRARSLDTAFTLPGEPITVPRNGDARDAEHPGTAYFQAELSRLVRVISDQQLAHEGRIARMLAQFGEQQSAHEERMSQMMEGHSAAVKAKPQEIAPVPKKEEEDKSNLKKEISSSIKAPENDDEDEDEHDEDKDDDDDVTRKGIATKYEFVPSMPEDEVKELKAQFQRLYATSARPREILQFQPKGQEYVIPAATILQLARPFLEQDVDPTDMEKLVKACQRSLLGEKMAAKKEVATDLSCNGFVLLMDEAVDLPSQVRDTADQLRAAFREEGVKHHFSGSGKNCSELFLDIVPPIVILLNSLQIGFSMDNPQFDLVWEILEYIFLAFYIFEAGFKMYLFGCMSYWTGPDRYWNWFDIVCICTSLVDATIVWSFRIMAFVEASGGSGGEVDLSAFMLVKMLRLFRLARLIRTLRFKIFDELKLMVMGVVSGLRVLAWAIVVLFALIYAIGLVMRTLVACKDDEPCEMPEFSGVITSMMTVFRCFTDGCTSNVGSPLQRNILDYSQYSFFAYILLYMLVQVGVFNLIMAIFIDNVVGSQQSRKQKELSERTEKTEFLMKAKIATMLLQDADEITGLGEGTKQYLSQTDVNRKGGLRKLMSVLFKAPDVSISRSLFAKWLEDEEFIEVLNEAAIETSMKAELFNTLDADMGGTLDLQELFTGLMNLRGDVTKADLIGMSMKVRYCISLLEELCSHFGLNQDSDDSENGGTDN
eukprot:TRINITY_DN27529_c0_g1_i1.p1 TRINITY_DN27529_c0_g1~~TRINITY_DN27529_c0_g1_i1.p1  ORF type:complete len:749 (-),score=138.87 TRINITY_DN27529_c0_g1_i1:360-2552(-)